MNAVHDALKAAEGQHAAAMPCAAGQVSDPVTRSSHAMPAFVKGKPCPKLFRPQL